MNFIIGIEGRGQNQIAVSDEKARSVREIVGIMLTVANHLTVTQCENVL